MFVKHRVNTDGIIQPSPAPINQVNTGPISNLHEIVTVTKDPQGRTVELRRTVGNSESTRVSVGANVTQEKKVITTTEEPPKPQNKYIAMFEESKKQNYNMPSGTTTTFTKTNPPTSNYTNIIQHQTYGTQGIKTGPTYTGSTNYTGTTNYHGSTMPKSNTIYQNSTQPGGHTLSQTNFTMHTQKPLTSGTNYSNPLTIDLGKLFCSRQ